MARPTTKPRVPTLDPERVALEFVRSVLTQWRAISPLLHPIANATAEPTEADLQSTVLYRDFVRIAKDAVQGKPPAGSNLSRLLTQIEPLLRGPFHQQTLRDVLEIDPDEETNPVKLVLAAAMIRQQLAKGTLAITSSQLAIVAGITRRHVGAEIREGRLEAEIAGRRGTAGASVIRPDEALRWLQERGV